MVAIINLVPTAQPLSYGPFFSSCLQYIDRTPYTSLIVMQIQFNNLGEPDYQSGANTARVRVIRNKLNDVATLMNEDQEVRLVTLYRRKHKAT